MSILYAPLLIIGIAVTTFYLQEWNSAPWLLAYFLAVNGVTFAAYVWDKLISHVSDSPFLHWMHLRIPNWVLIWMLGLLGGTIGAAAGMVVADHKTGADYAADRTGLGILLVVQTCAGFWLLTYGSAALEPLSSFIEQMATTITQLTQSLVSEIRSIFA